MSTLAQSELHVGDRAPDFTLPSTSGTPVTLSSHAGRNDVLLAFFPLAFTRVCTAELCSFWDDTARFEAAGAKVFGISVDHTASQRAFQRHEGFRTELLSDFKRDVARAYGVLLEDEGFAKRAYFLVDRQGLVRWMHVEQELGHRRENAELLAAIAAS